MPEENDDLPEYYYLIEFVLTSGKGMRWETSNKEEFLRNFHQIRVASGKRVVMMLGNEDKPEEGFMIIRMEDVVATNARALKLKAAKDVGAQPTVPVAAKLPGTYGGAKAAPKPVSKGLDPNWVPPPPAADEEAEAEATSAT